MKKLALALAALAVTLPAAAQSARDDRGAKVGIGISIAPFEAIGAGFTTPTAASRTVEVYLPIQLGNQLRLEPSLGIFSVDNPTNPGGGQTDVDTRDVTLGVGLFFVPRGSGPVDLYVGGRLKLNFARVEQPVAGGGTVSDSGTDLVLAAAVGGEYYLAPRFSLGLEGELGIFQNSNVSGDNSGAFTAGLAFLRVYF